MSIFDRFKKKSVSHPSDAAPPQWPQPPAADTMCLLLMDRVLDDIEPVAARLNSVFGSGTVGDVDHDHPRVPAFIVTIDGLEFWCSYLPMPVPREEQDIAAKVKYNMLLRPEEEEAFVSHKSFWLIAQKGGGKTLEGKRRACWDLSLLCAALLEAASRSGEQYWRFPAFPEYAKMIESPVADLCNQSSDGCGAITAVTDRDSVIAVAGGGKRELLGKRISPQLEQIMEDRRIYQHAGEERSVFVTESGDKYRTAVAAPIISEGDVLGLVLFVEDGENLVTGETEYKLAQTIAAFLGKHMES